MKEVKTLTVVDSDLEQIEAGTQLTVERDHVNQFTNRRTLTVDADPLPNDRVGSFQIMRTPTMTKDVWKEVVVGRDSDTIVVS